MANARGAIPGALWSAGPVQAALLQALARRAPAIRARWADLLRVERASSPLANPEALVHLIDWTLRVVLRRLQAPGTRRRPRHPHAWPEPGCPCGRNPLRAHFAAGEQALLEALVLCQAEGPHPSPAERDAALQELNLAFRHLAHREMAAFCALCLRRPLQLAMPPAARPPPIPGARRESPPLPGRVRRRPAAAAHLPSPPGPG